MFMFMGVLPVYVSSTITLKYQMVNLNISCVPGNDSGGCKEPVHLPVTVQECSKSYLCAARM